MAVWVRQVRSLDEAIERLRRAPFDGCCSIAHELNHMEEAESSQQLSA
ncbi:MAG: hypothetical protein WEE50_08000 [Chloroflexota bacterium]